jgi:hypothetical protein
MLNLLIAIMTDTYFKVVQGAAVAKWRLARVSMTTLILTLTLTLALTLTLTLTLTPTPTR